MKIEIETKYSVDDIVFIPNISNDGEEGMVDIHCRKVMSIDISISENPPLSIRYNLQGGVVMHEAGLYKTAGIALEAGIAKLVAKRISDDEDDEDDDEDEDEDDDEDEDKCTQDICNPCTKCSPLKKSKTKEKKEYNF